MGGASASTVRRILHRGPSLQDKIAAGASMFLSGPSPFGKLGFLLGNWDFYWEIGIFIGKTSIKGD